MEEDQELKHVCKFCNKSFPCGRSLGGHMRSHVINSAETDQKFSKKKLSSVNSGGSIANADGYGLRENPKKTCRFAVSKEDALLHDKFCKECGKGFQSWKALFGHMKCHSERFSSTVEEDSWTSANRKPAIDSQSDTETAAPNRKKRSRKVARYMATTTISNSFYIANNNASSSVSEIEQEQEEVAMCLMMLSRDVGYKGSGLNSVSESSDNNFELLEAGSTIRRNRISKTKGKNSWSDCCEAVKFKKLGNGKLESAVLDSENSQFDMKQSEFGASGFSRNGSKQKDGCGFEASEVELGKNLTKENVLDQAEFISKKHNQSKKLSYGAWDTEMEKASEKRSKFECTKCNKTFHSYQALGGHRASHKKIKGCFASKIDSSCENSLETEISPGLTADSMLIFKSPNNKDPIEQEMVAGYAEKAKKNKGHECPICFKVFSSGQALGGHKRSHLIGGSEAKTNQTIVIQKPIPEIRDLLDLNLPAPTEDQESSGQTGHVGFKPWWVASSHKHEPLLGLLSN